MGSNSALISGTKPRFSMFPPPPLSRTSQSQPEPFVRLPKSPVPSPKRFKVQAMATATATVSDGVTLSLYELLGIPETGSLVEIKQAYKELARKYHPDVSPPDRVEEYTQRFIMVQEAYETLSDPGRRALYDTDMSMGLHLAFSARKRYTTNQEMEEKGEWKSQWQSQIHELKRRSIHKDTTHMSWGAQMRRQRNQSSP